MCTVFVYQDDVSVMIIIDLMFIIFERDLEVTWN